ncbi:MAG TPA: MFS transporter [Acidimicrobiales bacterium]
MSLAEAADQGCSRRRVRQLASARVVSSSGSQAAQIALIYQIYAITRSGAWVAAALFGCISLAGLLGPISGWIADRFDRRRVMVFSELTAGAAYLGLVFAHDPAVLLTGALAATIAGSPFRAASAAAVPNLVEVGDLPWANAQLEAAFNVALVAGPLLGGALVAASGAGLVYGLNAASFAGSGILIALTRGSFGGGHANALALERAGKHLFAGYRFIATNKRLAPLAAASALAYGSFGAALVIDPALTRYFHAGSIGYGLLTALWGAGAVIGALLAGRLVTVSNAHRAVVWGIAAMGISLGSIIVLPDFPLIVGAGAIGGAGSGFVFIPWLLLLQRHSSEAIRGRVVAAAEGFDQVAFLIGMVIAVPIISWANPHHAYAIAGVLLAAATAITAVFGSTREVTEPTLERAGADE